MEHQEFISLCQTALNKLKEQGRMGKSESGCFYLAPCGASCIVGLMMPDDKTRKQAEKVEGSNGSTVNGLKTANFEWIQKFTDSQVEFLSKLQGCHDEFDFDEALDAIEEEINTCIASEGLS